MRRAMEFTTLTKIFLLLFSAKITRGSPSSSVVNNAEEMLDSARKLLFENDRFILDYWPYNDLNRVDTCVRLFATRFHAMSLKLNADIDQVLLSVARHNQDKVNNIHRLNFVRAYPRLNLHMNMGQFKEKLKPFDAINDMARGTIPALLVLDLGYNVNEFEAVLRDSKYSYPIWLELDIRVCDGTWGLPALASTPSLQMFLIRLPWKDIYHLYGVERSLSEMKTWMEMCQHKLLELNQSVALIFEMYWPDTDALETQSRQTDMIQTWLAMARLTKKMNTSLQIETAFDGNFSPSSEGNIYPGSEGNSRGWWTYNLTEKLKNPVDKQLSWLPFQDRNCSHVYSQSIKQLAKAGPDISFGQANFHVIFNQKISEEVSTVDQIVPIVDLISKRFSKVLYHVDNKSTALRRNNLCEYRTAQAVAVWNNLQHHCNENKVRHLEIDIAVTWAVNDKRMNKVIQDIVLASAFIDSVSKDTVRRIVLHLPPNLDITDPSRWQEAVGQLENAQTEMIQFGLKLGAIDLVSNVKNPVYMKFWSTFLLPRISFVYISYPFCSDEIQRNTFRRTNSLSSFFDNVTLTHNELLETLRNMENNISIPIGIYIDFMGAPCDWLSVTHSDAAHFWLNLTKYAYRHLNTPIIIGPAISSLNGQFAEWWRLSRNGTNYVVDEGIPFRSPSPEQDNRLRYSIGGMVVTIIFVVVIVFLKFRRPQKSGKSEENSKIAAEFFQLDTRLSQIAGHLLPNNATVRLPFNESLRIGLDQFTIDSDRTLGSGSFGVVTLAKIVKNMESQWVAAKSLHFEESLDTSSLRNLLLEIKITSYLGEHPNITQLVGAYIDEIESGKVFAFYELCHLGSLKNFLMKNTQNSKLVHRESEYLCLYEDETPTNELLYKWSIEIAQGMEYIASKHIIHGDLATRNVLLDKGKVAKICDFGLSRRMENYQTYVKQSKEPLPWRWMSYESLTNFEFSSKSDVWSYGVTLWEIFNKGSLPYPGLAWTTEFVQNIKSGMRLPQTSEINSEIYMLMQSCWVIDPKERQDFVAVRRLLETIMLDVNLYKRDSQRKKVLEK